MASYKTSGIVLRRFNFGEADRIVTFMTEDRGKLRAVARGVRRIKSRMAGHLELFCQVELMLVEGKNLDIITSAKLIRHFDKLSGDYDRLRSAYLLAEMTDKLTGDEEPHSGLSDDLFTGLDALDGGADTVLVELVFKLKLAGRLGYAPSLDGCMVCGRRQAGGKYWFSPERGGIVDESCRGSDVDVLISEDAIKLWRLAGQHSPADIGRVKGAADIAAGSMDAIDAFYDHVFGKRFKSNEVTSGEK